MEDLIKSLKSGGDKKLKVEHLMNLVMQFRKVCNHPDIFERKETMSPYSWHHLHVELAAEPLIKENPLDKAAVLLHPTKRNPVCLLLPRLIVNEAFPWPGYGGGGYVAAVDNPSREKLLRTTLCVLSAHYIHCYGGAAFGFLRLLRCSPGEAAHAFAAPLLECAQVALASRANARRLSTYLAMEDGRKLRSHWGTPLYDQPVCSAIQLAPGSLDWLQPQITAVLGMAHPAACCCPVDVYAHCKPFVARIESSLQGVEAKDILLGGALVPRPLWWRISRGLCGELPADSLAQTVREANFEARRLRALAAREAHSGKLAARGPLLHAAQELEAKTGALMWSTAAESGGMMGPWLTLHSPGHLRLPSMRQLIAESGKLTVMDGLLTKLKAGGHRVLIFCQMTKMIDILEDYMAFRKYKYVRLDGSSNLADRRDMVEDFQTRDDIFAFLLSTRAGGLGINLTAADTVIFYDNDWNPTQDAQAMDRTHRIGQTKQVTVYRLITRSSVEEKILRRAKAKQTIQKTVYSGEITKDHFEAEEMLSMLVEEDEEVDLKGTAAAATKALEPQGAAKEGEKRKPGPAKRKGIFGMVGEKKEKEKIKGVGEPPKKAKIDTLLAAVSATNPSSPIHSPGRSAMPRPPPPGASYGTSQGSAYGRGSAPRAPPATTPLQRAMGRALPPGSAPMPAQQRAPASGGLMQRPPPPARALQRPPPPQGAPPQVSPRSAAARPPGR